MSGSLFPESSGTSGRPLTVAVAGGGARGFAYANTAVRLPEPVQVVAVAEPRPIARGRFVEQFDVPAENVFEDWRDLAAAPRLADVVVISLLDHQHVDAVMAFAERGYHILLEKPMATTEDECVKIVDAVEAAGVTAAVCHVLRYTPYTLALQDLLNSGAIGEIASIEHLEPIGHSHFAHSFVRGNWRRTDESPLLLAKSCHDIDWLMSLVDRPVEKVASFGSLKHFNAANRPAGAADRCVDCSIEASCAFSAARVYRRGVGAPDSVDGYNALVMAGGLSSEEVEHALAHGPYGRCVYASDNDVVDHQVVQMEFEGGATVSFTLTAFCEGANRKTRIFGTRGQITGDGRYLQVFDFLSEQTRVIDTEAGAGAGGHAAVDGHGGGDRGLFESFIRALRNGTPEDVPSRLRDSLAGHRVVFAAERARRTASVVALEPAGK
ncbi:Gfo/Idh/MocA family protein [Streptomyces sp. NPDC020917]|uniref:Gfo/Idh/MocA family protein n=1 Tax=Streptomyces sp. NPDC020917 TaxID=3365102 RepID=UPI00378C0AFA